MVDSNRKVLVIGWDAADWKVINALIEQDKMPHTAALIERGVMGNLTTLQPVLSPMLWTSIATGKWPFKHGILGFSEPTPDGAGIQPVSQLSRKTKAVWNILNQEGYRCNVIGWWPSHRWSRSTAPWSPTTTTPPWDRRSSPGPSPPA